MTRTFHTIFILPVLLFTFTFLSCNKFLDKSPSKNTGLAVSTTAQLNALLDNYNNFYEEVNEPIIYSSDDYGWTTDLYNAGPEFFGYLPGLQLPLWDVEYYPTNENYIWAGEWKKIFAANMVLDALGKVTGTEEEKEIIKADAHFIRAYSYWILANTHCLPYTEANKNELGLTIKTSISFEEPLERAPLYKVYELIEADLQEALKTPVALVQNGKAKPWRANKAAVNGFAARYYLNRFNYSEAVKYADLALLENNAMVDYNTEMRYGIEESLFITTPNGDEIATIQYPYTHDNQIDMTDMLTWKESMYFRMLSNYTWWYIPSQELMDLYDHDHDLRYKYHIVEDFSYGMGFINPAYSSPAYVFFFKDRIISGPTVAEMLLIKAESLARTGNIPDALTSLNALRAKRMEPGDWVNIAAADQDEAIGKILEERRREMPFVQRWFDLRRYNNNEDPNDDVVLTKTFYPIVSSGVDVTQPVQTYTLEKHSRKYAAPLPVKELISGNGAIEQNKY